MVRTRWTGSVGAVPPEQPHYPKSHYPRLDGSQNLLYSRLSGTKKSHLHFHSGGSQRRKGRLLAIKNCAAAAVPLKDRIRADVTRDAERRLHISPRKTAGSMSLIHEHQSCISRAAAVVHTPTQRISATSQTTLDLAMSRQKSWKEALRFYVQLWPEAPADQ